MFAYMTTPLLTRMVGLDINVEIWNKLTTCFASHTCVQIKKLKFLLENPKKDRTINTYLLDIKKMVDSLTAIGTLIFVKQHIEVILDDLSEDCDSFITFVMVFYISLRYG